MALLVADARHDQVVARYAIGQHAARLRAIRCASGSGVAGWVAVTHKAAVNADPALDCGYRSEEGAPALRSCLAIPLVEPGAPVAVLALYRTQADAFTDDHVRLLELVGARLSAPLAASIAADPAVRQAPQFRHNANSPSVVRGAARA